MPELPEIETIRLQISKIIIGKRIETISIEKKKSFIGDPSLTYNSKIKNIRRFAKILVIDFSNKNKQKMDDVWNIPIIKGNSKENWKYDTQKPKELLRRIIESSTKANSIIADFFMGSGSTGEVALALGRKFIGCDIGDSACRISEERLSKLITP